MDEPTTGPATTGPTIEETGAAPAPAAAATPPTRRRWLVAGGIVLGVALIAVAVIALLVSGEAPSVVRGYAPSDPLVYLEARLDLPGDQRQQVGRFLAHFPGFDDQSRLEEKIEEALDRLVRAATDGRVGYLSAIEPWFGGELAVVLERFGDGPGLGDGAYLVVASVRDASAARAWLDATLGGSASRTEQHGGTELTVLRSPEPGGPELAVAVLERVLLAGDPASVRAAIDRAGRGELAANPDFAAARAALPGDRLVFGYVAAARAVEALRSLEAANAVTPPPVFGAVPEWTGFALRAESDALAVESVAPHTGSAEVTNRSSRLAALVPATTVALLDVRALGDGILRGADELRDEPSTAEAMRQVDQALGLLGGLESFVGWIGDAGVAVVRDGSTVTGGLVIVPEDRAGAERVVSQVRNLVALFGGGRTSIRREEHGGATIEILDLDLGPLVGTGLGAPTGAEGRLQLAWSLTGEVLALGVDPAFVRAILDAPGTGTLAGTDRYRALVDRVGAENAGSVFVDLGTARELLEGRLPDDERADYEADVRPYLEPFDALVSTLVVGSDVDRARMILTVE